MSDVLLTIFSVLFIIILFIACVSVSYLLISLVLDSCDIESNYKKPSKSINLKIAEAYYKNKHKMEKKAEKKAERQKIRLTREILRAVRRGKDKIYLRKTEWNILSMANTERYLNEKIPFLRFVIHYSSTHRSWIRWHER